jgi:hypothetical protein
LSKYLERIVVDHMRQAFADGVAQARHNDGQVHLEDAIAAAVKRGPVKLAKHK